MTMRSLRRSALALSVLAVLPAPASAQDYPNRPITIIVPFAPGGAADVSSRLFGQKLSERLGKPVVIDNRAGAGTVIGATAAAKAPPDGYTLFMGGSAALAYNITLRKSIPYDPIKDFVPLAHIASIPFLLTVHPSLPVSSIPELIKLAKGKPGELAFATSGPGSPAHLCSELLRTMTDIKITYVPYKGSAPALADFLAGRVPVMFVEFAASLPLIRDGKMRALGVTSISRVPALAEVAPIAEVGVAGYQAGGWLMLAAPSETPQDIVAKLNAEFKAIAALPDVKKQFADLGFVGIDPPPVEESRKFVASEIERWGKIMRDAGIAGSE
jgi:tripartite-type tricarboxylate transporter receptor subunit TctC